jgi:hypothetical protein
MAEWEKIDVNELRDIAAQEAAQRASLEGEKISSAMRAKEKERLEIRSEALTLVDSIPEALRDASRNPLMTDSGRLVQAFIPIASETINSCMSHKGSMSERDRKLIAAVRAALKQRTFDGAEVFLHRETQTGVYSNVDGDRAEGPCKHYFICAQVELD